MDTDARMPGAAPRLTPVSPTQRRYWVLHQLQHEPHFCNLPAAALPEGRLDLQSLEAALSSLTRSRDWLRTRIVSRDGQPAAEVSDEVRVELRRVEVADELTKEALGRLAREEAGRPFDLARAPLLRALLVESARGRQALLLTGHRCVVDDLSLRTLLDELLELSGARERAGAVTEPAALPASPRSAEQSRAYWRSTLGGQLHALNLPADRPQPPVRTLNGSVLEFELSGGPAEAFSELCVRLGADVQTGLLSVINILLFRYTGQCDLLVGTTTAGAAPQESARASAHHENLLVLRCHVESDQDFARTLEHVARTLEEARAHRTYPYDALLDELGVNLGPSRGELCDVHVALEPTPGGSAAGRTFSGRELGLLKYELDFDLTQFERRRVISVAYRTDIFDGETIERLAGHFRELVVSINESPGERLGRLGLLTAHETEQLLYTFNDTRREYPQKTVVELFEEQAERSPDHTALVYRGRGMTYAELNRDANRLAHFLREECGVGRDDFIDVMIDGTEWLVVAMLGVLKAGAAYMPVDPAYPAARMAFMLRESRARVHLCTGEHARRLSGHSGRVIALDEEWAALSSFPHENPGKVNDLDDLAYIIYTSGSTGRPKGILQTHRCLSNFLQWQTADAGFERGLRVMQFAASSFDVSVQEILHALLSGGTLHVIDSGLRKDLDSVRRLLIEQEIELVDLPFTVINVLFNYDDSLRECSKLRHLISAGEPLRITPRLRAMLEERDDFTLHNHYGPSETHMLASHSISRRLRNIEPEPPLGRPISNMRAYILSDDLQLVPLNVVGEIYIGGAGLSRGYIDEALTRKKFLPSPFDPGEVIYKTEDVGRWRPEGTIDLLGRKGDQVKIRGFRVELGEVEETLLAHESVRECVVAARRLVGGQNELVAYVVCDEGIDPAGLRGFVAQTLPDYMIPAHFVKLDSIPRSPNGKADRMGLPDPAHSGWAAGGAYAPPRDPVEEALASIWTAALEVGRVGIHDDFFELGGDSLKALMIVLRAQKQLGVKFSLADFFVNPTVAQLAAAVNASRSRRTDVELSPTPEQEQYELSNAQRRLWLVDQTGARDSALYNVAGCYLLDGELDAARLRRAVADLIMRHESLRTKFVVAGGEPRQVVCPVVEFEFEEADLSGADDAAERALALDAEFAARPFNLSTGCLFRARLTKLSETKHHLTIVMHHIVSDAWSIRVLLSELAHFYAGEPLPAPALQYRDYAAWQREALARGDFDPHRDYWHARLGGRIEPLDLPADRPRAATRGGAGELLRFEIGARRTQALRQVARENSATLFAVLVSLVAVLLHKYTGQEDILLGGPISGRDRPDLEGQIGFYVNTVVLRVRVRAATPFRELVRDVRETVVGAYEHQSYPFDRLVEELEPPRLPGRHPFFDVWVVLQDGREAAHGLEMSGFKPKGIALDLKVSLFDLSFQFVERDGLVECILQYDTDLYDRATAELMKERLLALVAAACEGDRATVGELSMEIGLERDFDEGGAPISFTFD